MKNTFLIFIVIAILFEVVADILFKKWAINDKGLFLLLGMILYALGTFAWAYSLKFELLSKAISVFTVLNLIVITLAGVIIFKENLSSANKIGISLGLVSIILLESWLP